MKYSTSNFVNFQSALLYYTPQGYTEQDVQDEIDSGAITIGKPACEEDEYITSEDGRYFINEM
jgi:hypothetical protein